MRLGNGLRYISNSIVLVRRVQRRWRFENPSICLISVSITHLVDNLAALVIQIGKNENITQELKNLVSMELRSSCLSSGENFLSRLHRDATLSISKRCYWSVVRVEFAVSLTNTRKKVQKYRLHHVTLNSYKKNFESEIF